MTLFNNLWSRKQSDIHSQPPFVSTKNVALEKSDSQKSSEWKEYKEKMGFAAGFFASLGGCFLALHYYGAKPLPPINVPLIQDDGITTKALSILGICIGIPSLIYLLTPSKPVISKRLVNEISSVNTPLTIGEDAQKENNNLKSIDTTTETPEAVKETSLNCDGFSDTQVLEDELMAVYEENKVEKKKKLPILIPIEPHAGNQNSLKDDYDNFIKFIRDKSFYKTSSPIITYLESIRNLHYINVNQGRVIEAIMSSLKQQLENGQINIKEESFKVITQIFKDLSNKCLTASSLFTIDLSPKAEPSNLVSEIIKDEEFVMVPQRDVLDSFILVDK